MPNKKIVKNTIVLYFRQVLILAINLYTLRVVLNELGQIDFGIFSVVAGLVTLCSFLPGTMAAATQRFISFAIGKNDTALQKQVFTVNLVIYFLIAIFAVLLLQTVGLWFVKNYLVIPNGRVDAAIMLYHFTIISFIASIFTAPLIAILIAHEDMKSYAYISVLDAFLKLGCVIYLTFSVNDKLIVYGILLASVSILTALIYLYTCQKKYPEYEFKLKFWNKSLFNEIVRFTSWTLFGQMSTVARNQSVTIMVNQMFNPIVAGSRAIALTVVTQVMVFSNNFNTSLYPPIIKSYATGNSKEMFSLVFMGSKLTFFLMWIFALPLLFEMQNVLTLWLSDPPASSVMFTRLALIEMLIVALSLPIGTLARAPGDMRLYELVLGFLQLGIVLFCYLSLLYGFPAYSVFIVGIFFNLIMFWARLVIVKKLVDLDIYNYLINVLVPISIVISMSTIILFIVDYYTPTGLYYSFVNLITALISCILCIFYLGIDSGTRAKIILKFFEYMKIKRDR